jgi:hypothetical protein
MPATSQLPNPSEQGVAFAQNAIEGLSKTQVEQPDAARLPAAEREKLLALAYDAIVRLETQTRSEAAAVGGEKITAQAFWWGWHLSVPHSQVKALLDGTEGIAAIVEAALNVVPEVGELIALGVKGYVALEKNLILLIDKGNGVYLSQTWLNTPGIIFVPTTR